jgi:succinate dehydrogenase/fumarate reductase-like Fe-S protein
VREFARTGTLRALWMQVKTGAAHVARRAIHRQPAGDPIEIFLRNYEADGFRLPDANSAALALAAEACLVCNLCSAECARSGGTPRVEPRDAVIAASRLAIDWLRLEITPYETEPAGDAIVAPAGAESTVTPCTACRACDAVCPAHIPSHRIQESLAAPRR